MVAAAMPHSRARLAAELHSDVAFRLPARRLARRHGPAPVGDLVTLLVYTGTALFVSAVGAMVGLQK